MLLDYLPLVVFFGAYQLYDIYAATAALMAASAVLVAGYWLIRREIPRAHAATAALALVFGGLTLAVHDPLFIKLKPSVVYLLFAAVLAGSAFIGAKPLLQRALEAQIRVPAPVWRRANWLCTGFCLGCAGLNLLVAFRFSEAVWVNFKLFGMLALSVAFMIGLMLYLMPHMTPQTSDENA